MRFAEHLNAHITPEWHKQYINYEEMKKLLNHAIEQAPSIENETEDIIKKYFATVDESFFHFCDEELKKINTFYSEKFAEATRKFATLTSELKNALEQSENLTKKSFMKFGLTRRKLQDFKFAFSEFYLNLILLQNYQNLNYVGFQKILKKHDKLFYAESGWKWREEHVESTHCFNNRDIDNLINKTETVVITELEDGNRQKAMKRLRVPPLVEIQNPWTTFKVGLFSGCFIILFIAVILAANFRERPINDLKIALRLYRGPFLIIEFIFLIGLNIYGWRSAGVNHVLIFELDPRSHLSEQHFMELAAIFGVVWTLSLLSFLFSSSLGIPLYVNPFILSVLMLVFLLNPFKVLHYDARIWLLKITGRIISAPFAFVAFADFWLADQMNSLAGAFLDFQFLTCFYMVNGNWMEVDSNALVCQEKNFIIRPIVNCLPAWFRFAQCLRRYRDTKEAFPHLVNAVKYSTTLFAVLLATLRAYHAPNYTDTFHNPYTWLWLIMQFISSTYAFIWDIKMDWGLWDKKAEENILLRDEIVYSSTCYYYFAIVEDFFLRFLWILSFCLTEAKYVNGEIMTTILAPLEVFRRFIWNFFRLENEHLNNCGKFRAVRDISIGPIDSSDQTQILRMMDEEDGVENRYKDAKSRPKVKKAKSFDKKHFFIPQRGKMLMDLTIDVTGVKP